jgi:hypothetical protein
VEGIGHGPIEDLRNVMERRRKATKTAKKAPVPV